MKSFPAFFLISLVIASSSLPASDGWIDLLAEDRTDAWRSARAETFPSHGWTLNGGILTVHATAPGGARGGDIVTRGLYADFEMEFEFRLSPGANSGVKIFVQPQPAAAEARSGGRKSAGPTVGLEFQILDDERHPDAKAGRNGNRTVGSLYDILPADRSKAVKPMGEWNQGRIVSRDGHVEFWMNGQITVAFDRGSPAFRAAVGESKFQGIAGFGEGESGHILLQDHGDEVSFRNVRVRQLPRG